MASSKMSNGCVDVLVVQQQDKSFKSTPFQIAFSSVKPSNKIKEVTIEVNGVKSAVRMYINKDDERPKFQRKVPLDRTQKLLRRDYLRSPSDSQEMSDDDRSERSRSRERKFSPSRPVVDTTAKLASKSRKLEALKNQAAPSVFWPLAWLKKKDPEPAREEDKKEAAEPNMEIIQEAIYEGEDTSNDPQFLLSLCGDVLRKEKNLSSKDILQHFHKKQLKYQDFLKDPLAMLDNQDLVVKFNQSIYTWDIGIAIITSKLCFGKEMTSSDIDKLLQRKKSWLSNYFSTNKRKYVIETDESGRPLNEKKMESQLGNGKPEDNFYVRYSKTPTSQQLKQLGLKKGANDVKFTFDESGETVECHIYLWDYRTKIVVSDIDGTISKTDVFGQLMPALNQTWIHDGVVRMFNKIGNNGYEIVYLTARAIVQYNQTRSYLFTFVKEGQERLPLGPVFTSPDGLFSSFKREVIDKQPDFLKTQILTAIKQNFPLGRSPLVGGFGNKNTDSMSYKNSGIKPDKIFLIGENSVVRMITKSDFLTSYNEIADNIDKYFPKVQKEEEPKLESFGLPLTMQQQISADAELQSTRYRKDSDSIDQQLSPRRKSSHGSQDSLGENSGQSSPVSKPVQTPPNPNL